MGICALLNLIITQKNINLTKKVRLRPSVAHRGVFSNLGIAGDEYTTLIISQNLETPNLNKRKRGSGWFPNKSGQPI